MRKTARFYRCDAALRSMLAAAPEFARLLSAPALAAKTATSMHRAADVHGLKAARASAAVAGATLGLASGPDNAETARMRPRQLQIQNATQSGRAAHLIRSARPIEGTVGNFKAAPLQVRSSAKSAHA